MASEEPGPREPPAGGKTHKAEAPATTARVRAARRRRGGPENEEARITTAEGQQERTAASIPAAQPTRTKPPEERTEETTGATGSAEPRREPAKATTAEGGTGCALEGIMFCRLGAEEAGGTGMSRGRQRPVWKPLDTLYKGGFSRPQPAGVA